MHTANAVVAWIATAQDRLGDEVAELGLHPRELAALTLVHTHDGFLSSGCGRGWG